MTDGQRGALFFSPPGGYPAIANVGLEIIIDAVRKGGRVPCDSIRADLLLCRSVHPDLLNKIANLDAMDFFYADSVFPRFSSEKILEKRDRYLEANGLTIPERRRVRTALQSLEACFKKYLRRTRPKTLAISLNSERPITALRFIRIAREVIPDLQVVLGGSALHGDVGFSIFSAFPEIDYLVNGRGECVGKELIERLHDGRAPQSLEGPLLSRRNGAVSRHANTPLRAPYPLPEMDDYYEELVRLTERYGRAAFGPLYGIAVPLSVGCWWGKCDFCSEPAYQERYCLQDVGVAAEYIGRLARKYHISDVLFLDSIQPPASYLRKLCELLERHRVPYRMSGEIHARIDDQTLNMLIKAGLRTVQIGLETYSQDLLDKMHKGAKVIDILRVLSKCATNNVAVQGNVIMQHPVETVADVRATARVMDLTSHLFTPDMQHYFVAHGSKLWQELRQRGARTFPLMRHSLLYPENLRSRLTFSYRYLPENRATYGLWRALKRKSTTNASHRPALAYLDGGESIQVIDTRARARRSYRLDRCDRDLVVACARPCRIEDLVAMIPGMAPDLASKRLDRLIEADIVFRQDSRYLSLAVPWRN
jgi:radical SAM superfamily enzyme YgiQ (UPF0313 family)